MNANATNKPLRPKAPLTVQVAAASWQSFLIALVVLAAPARFAGGRSADDTQLAFLVAGAVFVALCVFGFGCSATGFIAAIVDRQNRLRLFLHSVAGLSAPAALVLFVGAVVVAMSTPALNSRAYWLLDATLRSAELQQLPPIEVRRAHSDAIRRTAEISRGDQPALLVEMADAIDRLDPLFESYADSAARYEHVVRTDAGVLERIAALDETIAATESYRAAVLAEEQDLLRTAELAKLAYSDIETLIEKEFTAQRELAERNLEKLRAIRRAFDLDAGQL